MTPIDKLFAIEELKQLKARYFRYIDTKDWSGFAGLFADDAVFDITDDVPGCVLTGPAKIAELPARQLSDAVTVHHGHCPEINITSDRSANAVWAMEDRIWWAEGSSSPVGSLQGYGHYFETYERIDGRWFIKSMRLRRLRVDVEPRAKDPNGT
ncbi:MAG: nuclear transport factor 2 family protein [Steroidobacteraceae bacterium]